MAKDDLPAALRALTGRRIPGGCDDCDAYQELEEASPGVFVNTVRHDDGCPVLARYKGDKPMSP